MAKHHRFVICGLGGTGGWLAAGLAATISFSPDIDPKILLLVDGDNFEPKNHARQHFGQMGNKAQVRAAELQPMYPNVWIIPDDRYVVDTVPQKEEQGTRVVAAAKLLEANGDVVFTAVDNYRARADIVAAAAQKSNIDVFLVGNDDAYFGSVYHYQRRDGQDVTANPAEFKPELFDPPDRNPGLLSCQERMALDGGTQFLWSNMAVAAWAGAKVNQVIFAPDGLQAPWAEVMFDLKDGVAAPYERPPAEKIPEAEGEGEVDPPVTPVSESADAAVTTA